MHTNVGVTYVYATLTIPMADKNFPTILVPWEDNTLKRYDHTKEEILLSNIVAISKTAVIEPSLIN